jgi:hypothetical protein
MHRLGFSNKPFKVEIHRAIDTESWNALIALPTVFPKNGARETRTPALSFFTVTANQP